MLALVTGRGGLPAAVVAALPKRPLICALEGQRPDELTPDIVFRIEHLGTLFAMLKSASVTDVCLCGAIDRPKLDLSAVDAVTTDLLPILAAAVSAGEGGALRYVIQLFEDAGFVVRAAHELAPNLLPTTGVLTATQMANSSAADVALALQVLQAQGEADLGQACVVQNGRVLAREGARGTDVMLDALIAGKNEDRNDDPDMFSGMMDMAGDMLGGAADWLSGDGAQRKGRAGFLFKAPRPGQDLRADLPTIGPITVQKVIAAGLEGIVIEAGGVLVLEQPRVIAELDAAGLFLWVR